LTFSYYIFSKKGCFLSFEKENEISPLSTPLEKYFLLPSEKAINGPSLEKNLSDVHSHQPGFV